MTQKQYSFSIGLLQEEGTSIAGGGLSVPVPSLWTTSTF